MKCLRFLVLMLVAGLFFTSCQKEFSFESGTAKATLKKDSTGDCNPFLIGGVFVKDTVLKANNFIEIQLNVTQTGGYFIKTDTVNGYSFSASGTVALPGMNTIRLLGKGRPIVDGVDMFRVQYDTTFCIINIPVSATAPPGGGGGGGGGTTSTYTLGGSPGNCTGVVLGGTYQQSLATNTTNTAKIDVNVTAMGTYSITSGNAVNGVVFAQSGNFIGTGPSAITLQASGTPIAPGTFTYSLIGPAGTTCKFDITYTAQAPPGTFTFNCTAPTFSGTYTAGMPTTNANTVAVDVNVTAAGSYNITSNTMNGVTYAGTGTLAATPAVQQVTLTATGTPAAAGTFTYTLTGNAGATCMFDQVYAAAPPPPPPAAMGFIRANIDGAAALTTFNLNILVDTAAFLGQPSIFFEGTNTATGNEYFNASVTAPGGVLINTPYTVNSTTALVSGFYTTAANVDYEAFNDPQNPPVANPFTITFTMRTPSRIVGTFSGRMPEAMGGAGNKVFTNGAFDITF